MFERPTQTKAGKLYEDVIAESSGRTPERAAKALYAIQAMKNALIENGVDIKSKDAKDVLKAWNDWARTPENKDKFLIAQDKIQENLSWIGESTLFTKPKFEFLNNLNYSTLTGYVNGQVNKYFTDLNRVI